MIISHSEQREVLVTDKITCDRCMKTCDTNTPEAGEFLIINYTAGYGSVFGDGNTVKAEICDKCLKELLGNAIRIEE